MQAPKNMNCKVPSRVLEAGCQCVLRDFGDGDQKLKSIDVVVIDFFVDELQYQVKPASEDSSLPPLFRVGASQLSPRCVGSSTPWLTGCVKEIAENRSRLRRNNGKTNSFSVYVPEVMIELAQAAALLHEDYFDEHVDDNGEGSIAAASTSSTSELSFHKSFDDTDGRPKENGIARAAEATAVSTATTTESTDEPSCSVDDVLDQTDLDAEEENGNNYASMSTNCSQDETSRRSPPPLPASISDFFAQESVLNSSMDLNETTHALAESRRRGPRPPARRPSAYDCLSKRRQMDHSSSSNLHNSIGVDHSSSSNLHNSIGVFARSDSHENLEALTSSARDHHSPRRSTSGFIRRPEESLKSPAGSRVSRRASTRAAFAKDKEKPSKTESAVPPIPLDARVVFQDPHRLAGALATLLGYNASNDTFKVQVLGRRARHRAKGMSTSAVPAGQLKVAPRSAFWMKLTVQGETVRLPAACHVRRINGQTSVRIRLDHFPGHRKLVPVAKACLGEKAVDDWKDEGKVIEALRHYPSKKVTAGLDRQHLASLEPDEVVIDPTKQPPKMLEALEEYRLLQVTDKTVESIPVYKILFPYA